MGMRVYFWVGGIKVSFVSILLTHIKRSLKKLRKKYMNKIYDPFQILFSIPNIYTADI